MPDWQDIYLASHTEEIRTAYPRLRLIGRRLLRFPILRGLRRHARRAFAVTEPAGRIYVQHLPKKPNRKQCSEITVLSANLWHDWPRYRKLTQRLEAFADLVETEKADLILLQEVARTPTIHVDEWMAKRLGMAYVYSRANGHEEIGFEEGLAVLSRFPLGSPYLKQFKNGTPFSRRIVLGALVTTPCSDLMVFSVHLSVTRRTSAAQLDHLRDWIQGLAGDYPVLVGGDFNAHESNAHISRAQHAWKDTFRQVNPDDDGTTHELRLPWGHVVRRHRLDYIFLQPGKFKWEVLETRHLHTSGISHSDHCVVMTRLAPAF